MSISKGNVTISANGVVTEKTGLAGIIYDAILAAESNADRSVLVDAAGKPTSSADGKAIEQPAPFPDPEKPSSSFSGTAAAWKKRTNLALANIKKAYARTANALAQGHAQGERQFSLCGCSDGILSAPAAGDFTVGIAFLTDQTMLLKGVRFRWGAASEKIVRAKAWNSSSVLLGQADQVVPAGTATFELFFGTPIDVVRGDVHTLGLRQTDGAAYCKTSSSFVDRFPVAPFYAGNSCVIVDYARYFGGDHVPTSTGSDLYLIDPILELV